MTLNSLEWLENDYKMNIKMLKSVLQGCLGILIVLYYQIEYHSHVGEILNYWFLTIFELLDIFLKFCVGRSTRGRHRLKRVDWLMTHES